MSPTEADLIVAQLARMKALVTELERACADNAGHAEKFRQLKAELDAARERLKTIDTAGC